jgi:hypothetical protein
MMSLSTKSLSTSIFLLLYNLLIPSIHAQTVAKDSLAVDSAYAYVLRQYHAYLEPEPALYRGGQYVDYDFQLESGHPYFGEHRMRKGTVWYSGIFYEDILLLHDLVRDIVVINDPGNTYKITLISDQIDSFTIEDHFFIRLRDSLNPSAPRNGFYERLYKDRISLLKKEKKSVEDDLSSLEKGVQHYISSTVSYYLKKGVVYYSVNNKSSLLYALKDRNKEIRKFIRKNSLSMKSDKENTLLKVVAWYDGDNH